MQTDRFGGKLLEPREAEQPAPRVHRTVKLKPQHDPEDLKPLDPERNTVLSNVLQGLGAPESPESQQEKRKLLDQQARKLGLTTVNACWDCGRPQYQCSGHY